MRVFFAGILIGALCSMAVPILLLKVVTERLYGDLNKLAELFYQHLCEREKGE